MGLERAELTPAAREALKNYHFPGNVRELENVLERAVTLCASGTIGAADLRRGLKQLLGATLTFEAPSAPCHDRPGSPRPSAASTSRATGRP